MRLTDPIVFLVAALAWTCVDSTHPLPFQPMLASSDPAPRRHAFTRSSSSIDLIVTSRVKDQLLDAPGKPQDRDAPGKPRDRDAPGKPQDRDDSLLDVLSYARLLEAWEREPRQWFVGRLRDPSPPP
jgi:hypothetical protein